MLCFLSLCFPPVGAARCMMHGVGPNLADPVPLGCSCSPRFVGAGVFMSGPTPSSRVTPTAGLPVKLAAAAKDRTVTGKDPLPSGADLVAATELAVAAAAARPSHCFPMRAIGQLLGRVRAADRTCPLATAAGENSRWRVPTHSPRVGIAAGLQVEIDVTRWVGVENAGTTDVEGLQMAVPGSQRHLLLTCAMAGARRLCGGRPYCGGRAYPSPWWGGALRLCCGRAYSSPW